MMRYVSADLFLLTVPKQQPKPEPEMETIQVEPLQRGRRFAGTGVENTVSIRHHGTALTVIGGELYRARLLNHIKEYTTDTNCVCSTWTVNKNTGSPDWIRETEALGALKSIATGEVQANLVKGISVVISEEDPT